MITTRAPTPEERRLIAGRSKPDFVSHGYLAFFLGVVPAFLLGKIGLWWGSHYPTSAAPVVGQWIGWSIAALIYVTALVSFTRYERRRRLEAEADQNLDVIQDVHVTDPRVVEIGLINDNEPILAIDLGEDQILFLQGQWLREPSIYGAEDCGDCGDDPQDEFVNGLPAPHSFPSTEFTISRFPTSGEVAGIHVAGSYLVPEGMVEALEQDYEFGDSELLTGSLDDVADVLAREHERRRDRPDRP